MRSVVLSIYSFLVLSGLAIWVFARVYPAKIATLGHLFTKAFESRSNRIAILIVWWWVGWHFLGTPWVQ